MMAVTTTKTVTTHECKTYRDGDWLVFYCTTCKDYEKRLNFKTGEVVIRHALKNGQK